MLFKTKYFKISYLFIELALWNLFSLFLEMPSTTPTHHYTSAEKRREIRKWGLSLHFSGQHWLFDKLFIILKRKNDLIIWPLWPRHPLKIGWIEQEYFMIVDLDKYSIRSSHPLLPLHCHGSVTWINCFTQKVYILCSSVTTKGSAVLELVPV